MIIPKHLKITDSIVKPTQIKTEGIRKQYSKVNKKSSINEDEEVNNMSLSAYLYLEQRELKNQSIQKIANIIIHNII